jgi:hypothetical protein
MQQPTTEQGAAMRIGEAQSMYINFALNAVLGRLSDADAIFCAAASDIYFVAYELSKRFPLPNSELYRGLLLDPREEFKHQYEYKFLSWSEDRDVARWFASPDSFISKEVTERKPHTRGYVLTLPHTKRPTVLFHYSWANAFGPLPAFALMHPFMGIEGARQVQWSLRTQREVITDPMSPLPVPEHVDSMHGPTVRELDARLAPPWIAAEEGF